MAFPPQHPKSITIYNRQLGLNERRDLPRIVFRRYITLLFQTVFAEAQTLLFDCVFIV